jgi:hypothetical protein
MRTLLWIALIYLGLFGIMAVVNETVRSTVPSHKFKYKGIPTIHPKTSLKDRCTWQCHNRDLEYRWCRNNHVKMGPGMLALSEIPYELVVCMLLGMGDYQLANILLLVMFIPTAILWMLVRSIEMELSIRKLDRTP